MNLKSVVWFLTVLAACTAETPELMLPEIGCEQSAPMDIGRCIDARDGSDCVGASDEQETFVPVADGESLPLVVGPQNSTMFVLALRAAGIDPGDPEQRTGPANPLVEIVLEAEDGEQMSLLRRRVVFEPDPELEDTYFRAGFYVIIDDHCPAGRSLIAHATITDRRGECRDGALTFLPNCNP